MNIISVLLSFIVAAQATDLQGIGGKNLILKPLEGKTGEARALIFISGSGCDQESYVPHMKAIQEKVAFPLWVGLPHILGEQAIPPVVGFYIDNMQAEFKTLGVTPKKFFYGGHSLGAAAVSAWGHKNPETVEAVFVEGGYAPMAIEDPALNYGAPFLTVGAEFDGWMARITRMAEAYDEMTSSKLGYDKSKYSYPVVVLPGLGHASFLSGTPPPTVQ